jgi:cytochrome c-type biogenesis protein CcmH
MPAAATAAAVAHDEDIATEAAAVPPEDVAAIARSLNCPLCQGYNLQDCPLEVCAQMRELIRFRLAEGQTREQIVAAFVADYGPQVLNEPPRRGFFLGAWVLPLVALALGVAGVALYVRRNIAEPEAATESESAAAPAALDESMAGYALELERMIERDEQ